MPVKATCDLCKEKVDIYTLDMYQIGQWCFHERCYHIALTRLKPLADILFAPQDEWDEYLNEILHIKFRREADAMLADATLGIIRD